jgi:hypothetical protein
MSRLAGLLEELRGDWSRPRQALHRGRSNPFLLSCELNHAPASQAELAALPTWVSSDVRDFWAVTRQATLFRDTQYGQWGVEILSPADAFTETRRFRRERAQDFRSGDLVIGRFFGDSDLLIVRCNETRADVGSVCVALPIDPRDEWPIVASSFTEFLERLIATEGDKYWELDHPNSEP